MKVGQIEIDADRILELAERHALSELSIFGSALRDDFGPHGDVDVLFELLDRRSMSIETYIEIEDELTSLFGRRAHFCQKPLLDNPFRRHVILATRKRGYERPAA